MYIGVKKAIPLSPKYFEFNDYGSNCGFSIFHLHAVQQSKNKRKESKELNEIYASL